MACLEINTLPEGREEMVFTLSLNDLQILRAKLDVPGSKRELRCEICFEDGVLAPHPGLELVLWSRENDECKGAIFVGRATQDDNELVVLTLSRTTIERLLAGYEEHGSGVSVTPKQAPDALRTAQVIIEDTDQHDLRMFQLCSGLPGQVHPDTRAVMDSLTR